MVIGGFLKILIDAQSISRKNKSVVFAQVYELRHIQFENDKQVSIELIKLLFLTLRCTKWRSGDFSALELRAGTYTTRVGKSWRVFGSVE